MNRFIRALATAAAAVLLAWPSARAHEGHDHDTTPAAPAPADGSLRFSASSTAFELVGRLAGRELTLWLDRAATNAPVTSGTLELELGDLKLQPRLAGDTWTATLPQALPPGTVPVTASIAVGNEADLLAGELQVPPAESADPAPGTAAALLRHPWLALSAALVSAAVALAAWWRLRRRPLSVAQERP